jgi:methylenetetrahydrofolate dehydrogenase (NADP+) / methenyltetrahydrofolate cyclohydrolase
MKLIDGKSYSRELLGIIRKDVTALRDKGIIPHLAVLFVGSDASSERYVAQKKQLCEQVGIDFSLHTFATDIKQDELAAEIDRVNADPRVTACILQLPVPGHLNVLPLLDRILPANDADCLHSVNYGRLFRGDPFLLPPTPAGILALFDHYEISVEGKHVVIVGAGRLVGRALSVMCTLRGATVTVCTKSTSNLAEHTIRGDIVVAAAGVPGLITGEMIADGAVVVDVGLTLRDGRLVGDVDQLSVAQKASWLTPVPGGVGPMTVVKLLENVLFLATQRV